MQISLFSSLRLSAEKLQGHWRHLSGRARFLLVILAGLSLTVLAAGVILRQRRRRYRAISPLSESLHRQNTFQQSPRSSVSAHQRVNSFPSPIPELIVEEENNESDANEGGGVRRPSSVDMMSLEYENLSVPHDTDVFLSLSQNYSTGPLSDDYFDATDLVNPLNPPTVLATPTTDYLSDSEDSFESAPESLEEARSNPSRHQLYISSLLLVDEGKVQCRKFRTQLLSCTSDKDFLAKLYCVRLALNELLQSPANRDFVIEAGRDMMVTLLTRSQHDPQPFIDAYNNIIEFCHNPDNWRKAEEELHERGVVCMNVYDVALDFMLLDAFDDLSNPPSALLSVIQNGWLSDGIKQSMLNTAVWSITKAKKSLLKTKNGFMSRFYTLSETMSPLFAWGFLGNDSEIHQRCQRFKITMMNFMQAIFSLDNARYATIQTLADDIMTHGRRTIHLMSDM